MTARIIPEISVRSHTGRSRNMLSELFALRKEPVHRMTLVVEGVAMAKHSNRKHLENFARTHYRGREWNIKE